jgi:membrane protease subunit (stomatin/prohibitin family)
MFLCEECQPAPLFVKSILMSSGTCEGCGKPRVCMDVDFNCPAARSQAQADALAASTYPCPGCGKVHMMENCTCGRWGENVKIIQKKREQERAYPVW